MNSIMHMIVLALVLLMALPVFGQSNRPPVSVIIANPISGTAPLTVNFDGRQSSDDRGIFRYRWTLGDGTTAQGRTLRHTYTNAGSYIATLSVTDRGGLSHSSSVTITVASASSS